MWFPGIWSLTLDLGSCCKVADIFGKSFLLENVQVKDTGALLKAHTELHVDQKLILRWQVPDLKPVVNQLCNHILENKFYQQRLYFCNWKMKKKFKWTKYCKIKNLFKIFRKKRHILTAIINIGNFEAVVILMKLACKWKHKIFQPLQNLTFIFNYIYR